MFKLVSSFGMIAAASALNIYEDEDLDMSKGVKTAFGGPFGPSDVQPSLGGYDNKGPSNFSSHDDSFGGFELFGSDHDHKPSPPSFSSHSTLINPHRTKSGGFTTR